MSMQRAVFVRALRERGHNVSFTQFPHSLENYRTSTASSARRMGAFGACSLSYSIAR